MNMFKGSDHLINIRLCIFFDMSATPEDDKISAGLVSDRCQFCGASFNRANQLSLHYKEKHSDKLGEEGKSP